MTLRSMIARLLGVGRETPPVNTPLPLFQCERCGFRNESVYRMLSHKEEHEVPGYSPPAVQTEPMRRAPRTYGGEG